MENKRFSNKNIFQVVQLGEGENGQIKSWRCPLLVFVLEGDISFRTKGKSYHLMPGDMFPVQAGRSLSIEAMDDLLLLTCRLDRSSLALLSPFQSQILWLVDSVLPVKKLEFLFEKELKFIAQSLQTEELQSKDFQKVKRQQMCLLLRHYYTDEEEEEE